MFIIYFHGCGFVCLFLSEVPVHGFSLAFQEILHFSYCSLIILCLLRVLMLCLQVTDTSACSGPSGFVYSLQISVWYQVSQLRELLLTSFCLPEKSSVHLRLAASPGHKPSSCFRSRFRRDFPSGVLSSAFRGGGRGYTCSMEMVSSHSALKFSASPKRMRFASFFLTSPSNSTLRDTFVLHSLVQLSFYPGCRC